MKINELGLGFDLPSRSGALSFVKGSNFGPNEIAVTTTRNKKPLYFGLDHNEDLLMVDHFLQVNPIKNPLIKVLVDSHSDITNFPYYPDECLLGSWLQNAFDIGQADETAGLYWFYRLKGNAPSDFNGNTLDLPNFQGSGIKVTAVCIDGYEQNHKAIAKMDELRLLAQKGRVIGGSIDWDAGMGPNPHIDPSTKPDGYDLTENQNMEQHLMSSEQTGGYDIDLVHTPVIQELISLAGLLTTFRSPGYCFPPYAIFQERILTGNDLHE